MRRAYKVGIIATGDDGNPMYEVKVPKRSDVSQEDRAKRLLPDVGFSYDLAGAIHETKVTGLIQV